MLSDLLRWGGKRSASKGGVGDAPAPREGDTTVPSKALPRFLKAVAQQAGTATLLDLGPVIGSNVAFFGERLGCKLHIEDLYADFDRHARAGTIGELAATFPNRLKHPDGSIDGVLCWDFFDFLPKPASQALAREVVRVMAPGGAVLGFFTNTAVPRAAFSKFEVGAENTLRQRHHPGTGGAKHFLANRDIIRMFDGLVVAESFLLKNNIREILLRRKV